MSLWLGVVFGSVAWLAGPPIATTGRAALGLALTLPTLAQPFVQMKSFKMAARTALGVGSAWYALAILLELPWTPYGAVGRALGAAFFLVVFRLYWGLRERRLNDPCLTCPHGQKPFCAHYLPEFEHWAATATTASDRELAFGLAASIRAGGHSPIPPERLRRQTS